MASTVCSLDAASLVGMAPPFARLVAFGYDDGPTSGVAECEGGNVAYRFDLLATDIDGAHDSEAWDRGEELRAYGLAPLPPNAFARIVAALSADEEPRWPVWVPQGRAFDVGVPDPWDAEVAPLLELATPPELVIASAGPLGPIAAARAWPAREIPSGHGWFAYLGLTR